MQSKNILLSALLFISLLSLAQNNRLDSGYIIYTLAKDTVEITYYRLTGEDFSATVVQRANSNVNKITGRFFPNGDLQYMEAYRYKPVIGKDSVLLTAFRLFHKDDTTYISQKSGDEISEQKYPGRVMVSYWPYVQMAVI